MSVPGGYDGDRLSAFAKKAAKLRQKSGLRDIGEPTDVNLVQTSPRTNANEH
jgi:hypothetical protein